MRSRKARNGWKSEATTRRSRARALAPARTASCEKARYTSEASANAAAELKAEKENYPNELRAYYHRKCRGWHLTSQPKLKP